MEQQLREQQMPVVEEYNAFSYIEDHLKFQKKAAEESKRIFMQ